MGRKSLDWKSIRHDYEVVGLNPASLAEKYDCSAVYIYQRIRAESWRLPLDVETIDPEFDEDDVEISEVPVSVEVGKKIVARLLKELDINTANPGQMKQWFKDATAGKTDAQRRLAFQAITLPGRMAAMEKASRILKTLVEAQMLIGDVPRGKKAQLEKAAREMGEEDDMFAVRKMPDAAD